MFHTMFQGLGEFEMPYLEKWRGQPVPAYLDSLSGLIRCQALRLDLDGRNIIVRFRGKRNADMGFKGIQPWPRHRIVPRDRVIGRQILTYSWDNYGFADPAKLED